MEEAGEEIQKKVKTEAELPTTPQPLIRENLTKLEGKMTSNPGAQKTPTMKRGKKSEASTAETPYAPPKIKELLERNKFYHNHFIYYLSLLIFNDKAYRCHCDSSTSQQASFEIDPFDRHLHR